MSKLNSLRFGLLLLILCVALLGPGLRAASATDVVLTFTLSGTFTDGSLLGGTVTIDTTTGVVLSGDPTTSAPSVGNYPDLATPQESFGSAYLAQFDTTAPPDLTFPFLDVLFATGSLVGYDGGNLCSVAVSCIAPSDINLAAGVATIYLGSGSGSATPEPSSLVLFGSGLLTVGGLLRRKLRGTR
jgi:PEP-CTERM motif-containing protein